MAKKGFILSNKRLVLGIFGGYFLAALGNFPDSVLTVIDIAVFFGLSVLVLVAKAADDNSPLREKFRSTPAWVWAQLFMVYSVCFIALLLIGKIALVLIDPISSGIENHTLPFGGLTLVFASAFFCITGFIIWFLIPLLIVGHVPLQIAIKQAKDALMLNKFVFIFVIGVGASAYTFAVTTPALAVLWLTFVPSVMYASYKHIWWEKGNIKPSLFQSNATNAQQFH